MTKQTSFDTTAIAGAQRQEYWKRCVSDTYFPLELDYMAGDSFQGRLELFSLGDLSLSYLDSSPLRYRRQSHHLGQCEDESFLLSLPLRSCFEFTQRGRRTVCQPGSFVLERSGEPYEFLYAQSNALWVLKLPERTLRRHVATPDQRCALNFDATRGAGALFADYLALSARRLGELEPGDGQRLSRQLLELLGMALERQHPGESQSSAVATAHLRRVEQHIHRHLDDSSLNPAGIAQACGISVRYLHRLFQGSGRSVQEWVRELRLQACHDALLVTPPPPSIGELAYRWGFADQAHFNRAFKARYGIAPGELRRAPRIN
ncbi:MULTISPECIES: helix-turn-helix domain-containing protein [Pseudomonas]|uniref:AraC-like ligand-binding domain-containing protein n=1 Tax=Pseudomonas TaxID=286 RepID=UPI000D6FF717|nr:MULTISPECIES: helix-turn-helix domain-containing protein [unclassified Pseudomonas]MED5610669.1 helix-turn-helix domain-containing protein [Pseudomonas sp. JH-2]PWU30444.1 AraC family transcriptional regulator [Pseudomonas sp. RW407]